MARIRASWCGALGAAAPGEGGTAAPGQPELPLENWVRYWKSRFSNAHKNPGHAWQPLQWDRRLRSSESYEEKWEYVRNNPVRHKLVARAEDWPYQGELNALRW